MLYAQVGQHHLARATETSPKRSSGTLSCLSARPHDLADLTVARPEVACVPLPGLPCLYSKRAAAARSPRSRYRRSIVLWPFRANQPWNYPGLRAFHPHPEHLACQRGARRSTLLCLRQFLKLPSLSQPSRVVLHVRLWDIHIHLALQTARHAPSLRLITELIISARCGHCSSPFRRRRHLSTPRPLIHPSLLPHRLHLRLRRLHLRLRRRSLMR